jgi:hypothetical protein
MGEQNEKRALRGVQGTPGLTAEEEQECHDFLVDMFLEFTDPDDMEECFNEEHEGWGVHLKVPSCMGGEG